jgi:hypothetical protein
MASKSITGANIFKSGTWNKQTFTDEDLDKIVQAFHDANKAGRVPLKFGHNEEQAWTDGQPAIGWVTKIWRAGANLMADFSDIPENVYEFIKKGMYKFTSIELLKNAEYDGKRFPYVLDAVALLGAEPPAVDGLADLQKLALSRTSFKFAEALQFTAQRTVTVSTFKSGDRSKMDEKEVQAAISKAIGEAIAPMQAKLDASTAEVAKFKDENTKLVAKLAEQEKTVKAEKVKMAREAAVAVLEAGVRAKKITPAERLSFTKLLKIDNDDAVLELDIKDVEQLARVSTDDAKKILAGGKSAFSKNSDGEGDSAVSDNKDAEFLDEFTKAVRARAEKTGKSNFACMAEVVQLEPKFAKGFSDFVFDSGTAA